MDSICLEMRDVSYGYSRNSTSLSAISLRLATGAIALLGENGAGKSTLLELFAGLRHPRSGKYTIDGSDVSSRAGLAMLRGRVAYLPQNATQPGNLRVAEALHFAAWLARVPGHNRDAAVSKCAADLGLSELLTTRLDRLSGGLRQRVRIGQSLVGARDVLLLDEPTTAVDAQHRGDIRNILAEAAQTRLVVFSTHLSEDIEFLADRVVVLRHGRVVGDMTPDELRRLGQASPNQRVGVYENALTALMGELPLAN